MTFRDFARGTIIHYTRESRPENGSLRRELHIYCFLRRDGRDRGLFADRDSMV